jgi:hypothetical protein
MIKLNNTWFNFDKWRLYLPCSIFLTTVKAKKIGHPTTSCPISQEFKILLLTPLPPSYSAIVHVAANTRQSEWHS